MKSTTGVCACLALLWAGGARAQTGTTISFGPAQQLDHPPQTTAESVTRAGFNGAGYLVAWQGATTLAVRVSASGQVLDPTPVTVDATGRIRDLRISSNGDASLVTWYTVFDNSSGSPTGMQYSAQLVSSTLQLVGSPIHQDLLSEFPSVPPSSFDGTKFIVMTTQSFNGVTSHPGIVDFGVDLSGNGVAGLLGVPSPVPTFGPEVACAAGRCLVASFTTSNISLPSPQGIDTLAVTFIGEPSRTATRTRVPRPSAGSGSRWRRSPPQAAGGQTRLSQVSAQPDHQRCGRPGVST